MNGASEGYTNFSVDDLVWDDAFRSWVLNPTDETDKFWKEWLLENPQKQTHIDLARQVVQSLRLHHENVAPSEVESQFTYIIGRRDAGDRPEEEKPIRKLWPSRLFRIAALFIVLAGIGIALYIYTNKRTGLDTIVTASGIQKKILLSDSSSVVLNSNSKLVFKKHWDASEPREIWMTGEGYFEVKHLDRDQQISEHERFIVHVKGVTIEVLGTTFNIRNRRNKTEIVLKEGKIRLSFNDHTHQDIVMSPAQIVTIDDDHPRDVFISQVKPNDYSAWIHQRLVLSNTHLGDIIQYLEDNYGKKFILTDTSMQNKRIDGTLMLDNLDDALFILSKVLKVRIQENDSTIYFIKM